MLEADWRPASGSELGWVANAAGAARAQQSRAPGEAARRRAGPPGVGCYLEELENCCDVCLI